MNIESYEGRINAKKHYSFWQRNIFSTTKQFNQQFIKRIMSNNNKQILPEAKRLYLEGRSPSDILKLFPTLSSSTLYTWKKKFKWDELRDTKMKKFTNSPEILLDMLEELLSKVPGMLASEDIDVNQKSTNIAKISDSVSKICSSIKSLSKDKDRLSAILFSMEELGNYINIAPDKHLFDDEFRIKFDALLSGFSSHILDKYSEKGMG